MGAVRARRYRRRADTAERARKVSATRNHAFSAYAYVGESVEHPLLYYENNFTGSVALLRTVLDYQHIPLVFLCAIYGIPEHVPIPEEHPPPKHSNEGISESAAPFFHSYPRREDFLLSFHHQHIHIVR
jgi:UDP-glucose 4-epimerase